jgi:hypothetical protein
MKTICFFAIAWLFTSFCFAEVRTWTSADGKSTIQAKMVAVKDNTVVLQKEDGTTIKASFVKFSSEDRRFLEKIQSKELDIGDAMLGVNCGTATKKMFLDAKLPIPPRFHLMGGVVVFPLPQYDSQLKDGDIVFRIDRKPIKTYEDLGRWCDKQAPGQRCTLRIMRYNGTWKFLEVQDTLKSKSTHERQASDLKRQQNETVASLTKRNEEYEREAKQKDVAHLKKCPLRMNSAHIGEDILNQPTINLTVENLSSKSVVAYKCVAYCYNRFNEPVSGLGKDNEQPLISQTTIRSGVIEDSGWVLHFRDNTTRVKVIMQQIMFADGSQWKKNGKEVVIWAESPN